MKVIIIGGGQVGDSLCRALLSNKHQVTIIEEDSERCNRLVRSLNSVVINGDGTSLQALTDAETQNAEVVVALTGRDQDNLVACQLAQRHFKVPRTIARVSDRRNRELFQELGGVDATVCTTEIISSLIEEKVSLQDMITLLTFEGGEGVIVETIISHDSPSRGKKIVDLNLPQECVIISVIREGHIIFPHGQTMLKVQDKVLALTTAQKKSIFQGII